MSILRGSRVNARQVLAVLACALALYFVVAFAARALDAHRLRGWRDRLVLEIAAMERERDELQQEVQRREGLAWVDERLRDSGLVPPGLVSVIPVPVTPEPTPEVVEPWATPQPEVSPPTTTFFHNSTWDAWMRAIRGAE